MAYFNFIKAYHKGLIFIVLFLIFWGALVKSHEAGLSVPDWPTTYGYNMFAYPVSLWKGGIFYEHIHRLIASAVGALTGILAVILTLKEERMHIKIVGWLAFALVCIQGILGGLTVIFKLPTLISAAHGIVAQTFLLLLVFNFFLIKERGSRVSFPLKRESLYLLLFLGALYLQLILGAFLRHTQSGLALLTFPSFGGNLLPVLTIESIENTNRARALLSLPPVKVWQMWLNIAHRLWAIVLVFIFATAHFSLVKQKTSFKLSKLSWFIFILIFVQIALGGAVVLLHKEPFLTSLHVLTGALILAVSFYLLLSLQKLPSSSVP